MAIPITEDTKEGAGEIQAWSTIDTPDDELVRLINKRIQGATKEFEEFRKEGLRNERYWSKDQLQGIDLRWHNSRIIQNRIYLNVETMVPIITSKPAEPVISIANDDKEETQESRDFIDSLQKVLLDKYYDEDYPQQELFEMISRHLLLFKIGEAKIIWYDDLDDFVVEFVHPHKNILGVDGYYSGDVWNAQYLEESVKELTDKFPDKKDDLLLKLFPNVSASIENFGDTPVGLWEYWPEDGRYVVWKMRDVILQKKVNPYIIWKDDKTFDKENNHFDYPKKPTVLLNSQTLGRHIWDDTSVVSQAIPLQDGINLMQRIITDTSRDQGILVGAMELIDKDELYKYTGAYSEKLAVKGGDPTKALFRVEPKTLQSFVQDNLLHLENAMDNVMGVHSTTRGEKSSQPTLGQDQLSKEGDYGRIDGIVRGLERVATEIYNWELQMMAVKYKSEHFERTLGEKRGKEFYKEFKEALKKGIKIVVKPGSTLPTDKKSQRDEAIELAKAGKISTPDFFERMDYPNPKKMAQNLWLENNAPEQLYPELAEQIKGKQEKEAAAVEAQIKAQAAPVPVTPVQPAPQPAIDNSQGEAAPVNPAAVNQPLQQPAQSTGQPTEHTELLLSGQPVEPFEGIDPSVAEQHLSAELQFMGSEAFAQLDPQIQAFYAQHVMQERELLTQQGAAQA